MNNYPLYEHSHFTDFQQLVTYNAEIAPDQTAFQYLFKKRVVSITYRQFQEDINALSAYFHEKGLQNVKIAILGENSYEWILTYFAVVLSGNVVVPIDKELSDEGIAALLARCHAAALVSSDAYADTARKMYQQNLVTSIFHRKDFPAFLQKGKQALEGCEHSDPSALTDENALCAIIFTSGTTGEPKGVLLTQKNLMTDAVSACQNVWIAGASLLTLPLHHTFAFTASVLAMLVYRVPIGISGSLRNLTRDMQTFRPQNMFVVPLYVETIYKNIWKTAREQGKESLLKALVRISNFLRRLGIDLRSKLFHSILRQFGGNLTLLVSGGAPLKQSYADGIEAFGIQVLNGYGITECAPVVAVNRNRHFKSGSIGLALSCCEVKIRDDEIWVRGDNVMSGYYEDEAATREALKDGWFRTGDIGYLDEDGFLFVTGRKKNLIILSNGKNVAPEELEEKILDIDGVEEVVVRAENDRITAEIFAAKEDGIREGITALNRNLPGYERIQKVTFRAAEFEKTTTKKIKR